MSVYGLRGVFADDELVGAKCHPELFASKEQSSSSDLSMKRRIAIWAGTGFLIASFWAIFSLFAGPILIQSSGALGALILLTCPLLYAGSYFHFGVKLIWVLASNAAVYAIIGCIVEVTLRQIHYIHQSR
jgi:hypothetical protein